MKASRIAVIPTLKFWRHELRDQPPEAGARFAAAGVEQLGAYVPQAVKFSSVGMSATWWITTPPMNTSWYYAQA
jgi:hypothetical protein